MASLCLRFGRSLAIEPLEDRRLLSATLTRHPHRAEQSLGPGVRLQRQPLRGQSRQWHGERVRTGEHHAHRHPHRAELSRALAFDASGNLYVANEGNGTVSEFAPGSTTPTATLTGLSYPVALAFDASGNLYVANDDRHDGEQVRSGEHHAHRHPHRAELSRSPWRSTPAATSTWPTTSSGTVSKFAPGSTTPTATLTGLNDPDALAFDSSGNLYVANWAAAMARR